MKFPLLLLLTGSLLVASSQLKPWPKYCAVRHVPLPIFWPHSSPYGDPDAGQVDSGDSDYAVGPGSADSRNWAGNSRNAVQQRFGFQPFYRTTFTVTSSVVTAIVRSCIPSSQFVKEKEIIVTTPCVRKKRELIVDIKPSPVEDLLPTAVQNFENDPVETQIASSRDEVPQPHDPFIGFYRAYRAFNVVYTFTSTSYVFNSTIIKKTISLAKSDNVLCLPDGFIVC